MNPLDVKLQKFAIYPIPYPAILGEDVAGEVVQVGENASFTVGDRVIGATAGMVTKQASAQAFQEYAILETNLSCKIPASISYEDAVVLPLAITTAAAGLFAQEFLSLRKPTTPTVKSSGEVLVIWGGASSVGTAAVQLAKAAGYEVVTTASKKNFELVKKLGAGVVVDYNDENAVEQIVQAVKGKNFVGVYDAVGGSAWKACVEVASRSDGNKFVASTVRGFPEPTEGVIMKAIFSLDIMKNEVGKAVWEDFLPAALEKGEFVCAPEPIIAGRGLESVQAGLDMLSKGVSAKKVVVTL